MNDLDEATHAVGSTKPPGQAQEEGNKTLVTNAPWLGQILARTAPYAIASPGGT